MTNALALLVLLGACSRGAPPPRSDDAPPRGVEIVWKNQGDSWSGLLVDGSGDEYRKIYVRSRPEGYQVDFRGLLTGTTWEALGRRAAEYEPLTVPVDATMTFAELRAYAPPTDVIITLPDGRTVATKLPAIDLMPSIGHMFDAVVEGPVRFAGEPADTRRDTLIVRTRFGYDQTATSVIGTGTRVRDIDLVLQVTHPTSRGRTITQGELFERRTGTLVARKPAASSLHEIEAWAEQYLSP